VDVNAFYYTLSTICQTLGGAFGFLVAIALYQMQRLGQVIRNELNAGKWYRPRIDQDSWENASVLEDWDACIRLLDANPIDYTGAGTQTHEYRAADRHAAVGKHFVGQLRSLTKSVLLSAMLTFAAIALSLIALPWSGRLFASPLGLPLLGFAEILAIGALLSYANMLISFLGLLRA
jgi:hypothetical protein